jgi:hypothetical protein
MDLKVTIGSVVQVIKPEALNSNPSFFFLKGDFTWIGYSQDPLGAEINQ